MTFNVLDQPSQKMADKEPLLRQLESNLEALERATDARALAVAVHDLETGSAFSYNGERWFHAASTIKLAILAGVYSAIHRGLILPHARLHVRNRFHSALDGIPFRVRADRDPNPDVQGMIGKTLRISELAHHMIVTSSNLAANLLLDLVGLAEVHSALVQLEVAGIDVRRGVEDERAWEAGINNLITANGLTQLLKAIAEGKAFTPELSNEMLNILHCQEFRSGIPAHLPREVKVAHKTGTISTIAHDAGIVFVPGRKPYVLAILTEWSPEGKGRSSTIATISRSVYESVVGVTSACR